MMTQPTLFDPPAAQNASIEGGVGSPERAKTDAIAQVERNNSEFVDVAFAVLTRLSLKKPAITALDVWNYRDEFLLDGLPSPTNPRAIGAAFVRARHAGLLTPTNQWVKSGRVSDHNQQLRVWRSEVFRG